MIKPSIVLQSIAILSATCVCALGANVASQESKGVQQVRFASDVLPILSDKCFVCHGPDAPAEIDLRLDSFEAATADRGGYQVIDPAKPDDSELLFRIHSVEDPMPPVDAEKQLTDAEKEILTKWIKQGGAYEQHWAFVVPEKRWPDHETSLPREQVIDAFVQAKLRAKGVEPAPEAERSVLARRVALTLTGLPPEPEQLASFLNDSRPDAYERFVDQLLASPRFGEHQARYWLDAVRYGDTHGLHLDNRRGIYPYRDWVVRAFNRNLPLDSFIEWQIAGDLLPDPSTEQLVATGFVRLNPSTSEGGAIPDEFQAKNNFDRTETLGTVLLGMTLTCARCHTHKYDPITQTEYYKLLAFFNSTAENPMDGNSYTYGPTVDVPEDQNTWVAWETFVKDRRNFLSGQVDQDDLDAKLVDYAQSTMRFKSEHWQVSPTTSANDPAHVSEDTWQDIAKLPGKSELQGPEKDQAIWLRAELTSVVDQTLTLQSSGSELSTVYLDGNPLNATEREADGQWLLPLTQGEHKIAVRLEGRDKPNPIELHIRNPWETLAQSKSWSQLSANEQLRLLTDRLSPAYRSDAAASAAELLQRSRDLRQHFTTTLVAKELPNPRETYLLRRGEYNLPTGEPLTPDVPQIMGPLPSDVPANRLGLAKWLTSRKHPLVSRVLVNRIWQQVFGAALVRTPEDFGLQGQQPTHPELLDWLAVDLQDQGWDLKSMLRLMVTSKTFKQQSTFRRDIDDPENRLFARGPRYRLDAEVIRDLGLWSSGLLDPQQGGEGVKPYQPPGMWMAMAHPASNTKQYVQDHGTKLYRRSLYVYWKRTSPHPMMTLFDAPDRESSCVRRSRTNTPLQSLGLLNETMRIEMSRKLAERLIKEEPDDLSRFDRLFKMLACRPPSDAEQSACQSLLEKMKNRYAEAGQDAEALLSIGEAPRDDELPVADVAAWSQVITAVLASDIAILMY